MEEYWAGQAPVELHELDGKTRTHFSVSQCQTLEERVHCSRDLNAGVSPADAEKTGNCPLRSSG